MTTTTTRPARWRAVVTLEQCFPENSTITIEEHRRRALHPQPEPPASPYRRRGTT